MKNFFNNVLNSKNKKLNIYNTNYAYAATVFVSVALVLFYFLLNDFLRDLVSQNIDLNYFIMCITHGDTAHLLGNLLSFVIASILLERWLGSIKYFSLILFIMPISSWFVFTASGNQNWIGASGWIYFLIGVVFALSIFKAKYLFNGKQKYLTLSVLALLSVIMSFAGSLSDLSKFWKFAFFYDLYTNLGHLPNFIAGFVLTFIIPILLSATELAHFKYERVKKEKKPKVKKEKVKKEKPSAEAPAEANDVSENAGGTELAQEEPQADQGYAEQESIAPAQQEQQMQQPVQQTQQQIPDQAQQVFQQQQYMQQQLMQQQMMQQQMLQQQMMQQQYINHQQQQPQQLQQPMQEEVVIQEDQPYDEN